MQLSMRIDVGVGQPFKQQVFEQTRLLIIDGRLRAGAQVPASGALAADLWVSRNTVVLAYERLVDEGCLELRWAWCLDMHTKDTRARGETDQRLYLLPVWREAPCCSARERAAHAWAETLTQVAAAHDVPDAVCEEARRHVDEKALVDLTLAIIAINGWNRRNAASRTKGDDYVSPHAKARR